MDFQAKNRPRMLPSMVTTTSHNSINNNADNTNTNSNNSISSLQKQQTGKNDIIGQKIVIFNSTLVRKSISSNNSLFDFLSLKKPNPTFRPVSVKFNQDQTALYVVSMGKEEIRNTLPTTGYPLPRPMPWFYQHTGILWKVTNSSATLGMAGTQPPKNLRLSPEFTVTVNSGAVPRT